MFILETSIKCQFSTIKISQLTKTSRSLVCDLNKSRFSDLVFQGPNVNFRKVDLHRYWTEKWHLGVFVLFCFNFSTGTRCFKFKSPIQERWVCICTQLMTFWLTFFHFATLCLRKTSPRHTHEWSGSLCKLFFFNYFGYWNNGMLINWKKDMLISLSFLAPAIQPEQKTNYNFICNLNCSNNLARESDQCCRIDWL